MHIDTLILLVIILKIVSLLDLSLRAAWGGHWLCSLAKRVLRDISWKEIIFNSVLINYLLIFLRYDECKEKLTPYLKKVGFNPAKDIRFMPCSGLTGAGLQEPVGANAPWYT